MLAMKIPKKTLRKLLCAAALAAAPVGLQADTITFAEYDGVYGDDAAIPAATDQRPYGVPDGITASWTGFALHTLAGDTPMSVYPTGNQAVLAFGRNAISGAGVIVSSINAYDTDWGDPMTIIGKMRGIEVWKYVSPGDHTWTKLTVGAGKVVDQVIFIGKWNHYDDIEVQPAPDSDGDGYVDADENLTGHDPNNGVDMIENTAIANSISEFSPSYTQGENDWYGGYRNFSADGGGIDYDPAKDFIPFEDGVAWDLDPAGAPWTELYAQSTHPNGSNNGAVHWTVRRWVANEITKTTPLAIRWHVHHANVTCGGNGVTGSLYRNGKLLDTAVIGGPDDVGIIHTYYVNAEPGDRFDVTLSPRGLDGQDADGCDGSVTWFLVDPTIPGAAVQPDGSPFVPVGATDSDGDGLPDAWEKIYFPNDLTRLSGTGDYDKDGATDLAESQRGSDPTKPDTDGDGLSDGVETGTGVFVSKSNTGSNPTKVDSDGDGLSDSAEVNGSPATNPNKADSDGDSFSDADEIAWGSDPNSAQDSPTTYVIANSQAEFSGTQGKNNWYFGYVVYDPTASDTNYNYNASTDFVPFPGGEGQGDWDGYNQTWNGAWDLNTAGAGPWTYEAVLDVHPNGTNSPSTIDGSPDPTNEQWVTRRWVAKSLTKETPVTIIWQVKKSNVGCGGGVTGLLFINGNLVDSKSLAFNDGQGEIRRYKATLKANDIVDLALAPVGPDGDRADGCDGSQTWFWVDTRPTTAEPPTLAVAKTATGITLTFTGTLQTADKVEGPYTDVNQTSPVSVLFSSGPAKFYRAKK